MLVKASSPFVYQCLDNVEINKCAKFDQNIPCCSRVMSVFIYHYRPNGCSAKPRPRFQGRRRFLKSGAAIEPHRRSARAEGSSAGGGGERESKSGVIPPLVRGVGGLPRENF